MVFYREVDGPKETHAELELKGAEKVGPSPCEPFESGYGRTHFKTYHLDNQTIQISQAYLEPIEKLEEDAPDGWQNRHFFLCGQEPGIKGLLKKFKEAGTKLELVG